MSSEAASTRQKSKVRQAIGEGPKTRMVLIAVSLGFLGLMLIAPLLVVFVEAFSRGLGVYFDALALPDTMAALQLTLLVAAIAVPANLVFGVAAAWLIAKFDFKGKSFLLTLIDLPFAVSPVVSGLIFVLLFGANSVLGPVLDGYGVKVLFAVPGIVIATIFITFPFIARELIPLMQQQGSSEEEAAVSLGASGWRTFFQVTLPNVKWGLLYGVLLCNARAMGEFGAVSVVSGHIRGVTNTLPLHIEILYNDNKAAAAFAVASLLAMLALLTLAVKTLLEARFAGEIAAQRRH
ncbi:MAG TPA: sulfate ABC transporter permease subunit CysW [Hyphomonadaceae bacterium]|jgi:sulfate transport system permease protein|nr:sulfate ABC transporter permease subunit CysW [Hyphomonadaceae bacterium]HPI47308.1 sulfate ABC transporter permease subunit CysW [Hyphomonadaceae bacterium]